MKLKIRLISLLLIFCFVFSLTGCSDTKDAYIYFELPDTPMTLDPQVASSDSELLIIRNIYEGLLRKDSKGKIVCGVAESYKKNGLVYTFNIKKDAKWHNGDTLDVIVGYDLGELFCIVPLVEFGAADQRDMTPILNCPCRPWQEFIHSGNTICITVTRSF